MASVWVKGVIFGHLFTFLPSTRVSQLQPIEDSPVSAASPINNITLVLIIIFSNLLFWFSFKWTHWLIWLISIFNGIDAPVIAVFLWLLMFKEIFSDVPIRFVALFKIASWQESRSLWNDEFIIKLYHANDSPLVHRERFLIYNPKMEGASSLICQNSKFNCKFGYSYFSSESKIV